MLFTFIRAFLIGYKHAQYVQTCLIVHRIKQKITPLITVQPGLYQVYKSLLKIPTVKYQLYIQISYLAVKLQSNCTNMSTHLLHFYYSHSLSAARYNYCAAF